MGLYEVPLSMTLLGFGIWTMLANFYMFVLRSVFNMIVRNASPRGPMYFRCLMFSLSGHCELLFSLFLSVPSIGFVYVFVCGKLSPRLRD